MTNSCGKWKNIRLKHLSRNIGQYGANLSAGNYLENGVRFLRTTDIQENGELITSEKGAYVDKSLIRDYLLQPDDILFSRSGTLGRSYLHKNNTIGDFAFAGYLVRFRLNHLVHPKFIFYVSKSSEFSAQIEADAIQSTISNFNGEKYGNIGILIPPLEAQKSITSFLDRKTATIDTLIAKKQRLIQLLEEKRTALIDRAVTKGLNPNAPIKDSGISWIGEIPENWEVVPVKRVASVFIPQRNKPELNEQSGYPWITLDEVGSRFVGFSNRGFLVSDDAIHEAGSKLLKPNAVITGCVGTFGTASITKSFVVINQQLQAYIPKQVDPDFLRYCIINSSTYFKSVATETTIAYVNREGFEELPVPFPSMQEQELIATWLLRQHQHFDRLEIIITTQLEKLQEYRRSLITAAVTGKLEIQEVTSDHAC